MRDFTCKPSQTPRIESVCWDLTKFYVFFFNLADDGVAGVLPNLIVGLRLYNCETGVWKDQTAMVIFLLYGNNFMKYDSGPG